jgi:hypothetical protein
VMVREIISSKSAKKSCHYRFQDGDDELWSRVIHEDLQLADRKKSFKEIFHQVFIPLLEELGLLWQTDTITIAHEHFMSYLIKQKYS